MLTAVHRQDVYKWVQELKMLDSYALNLGRCVNVAQRKFLWHKKPSLSCIYRVFAAYCIEITG